MASPPSSPPLADSLGTPASSDMSIGFPEPCPSSVASVALSNQPVIPPSEKNATIFNACCVGIYCELHDKFQLTQLKNKGLFLPTAWMHSTDSWTLTATSLVRSSLRAQQPNAKITSPLHHVDWYRVQQPKKAPRFQNRICYVASIVPDAKSACVCLYEALKVPTAGSLPNYEWLSLDEIKQRQDSLWGPEAYTILAEARENYRKMRTDPTTDVDWGACVHEIDVDDSVMMLANRSNEYPKERELLFSARFTEAEIHKLFNEFVVQCFPSQFMCFASFRAFMAKLGWHEEESLLKAIFTAFVTTGGKQEPLLYLTFNELLLGLAAMEERTDHRGNCLRLRLKFIFNFYDDDCDNKLNPKEVSSLVADISAKKGPASRFEGSRSNDGIRQEMSVIKSANSDQSCSLVGEMYRQLAEVTTITEESVITLSQFTNCEDAKTLEWLAELTEPLFRSSQSTIEASSQKFAFKRSTEKVGLMASQVALTRYDEPCEQCRQTSFDLCAHGIRIDEYGRIRGTIKFDLSPDFRDVAFRQEVTIDEATFDWTMQFTRFVSTMNTKNASSRPNRQGIKSVLKLVLAAIQEEPLVARPFSPCFIIGEVRSNLEILYRLQTVIARWIPFVNPVNVVFLGNLIDPSEPLAADTAVYLFCLKALAPNRITLVRGPMEFLAKLPNSKLHQEWLDLYGEDTWKEVGLIFDLLPFAAVVDECLFLTKSGLPQPIKELGQIEALNQSPKEPVVDSALMNALLNGVPVKRSTRRKRNMQQSSQQTRTRQIKAKKTASELKAKKMKRKAAKIKQSTSATQSSSKGSLSAGTKHALGSTVWPSAARSDFTPSNLHQFMRVNHFSHVIRTEMLHSAGALGPFRVADHDKLITIGGIGKQPTKEASGKLFGSIVLANRQKIRLIRLGSLIAQ